MPLDVNQSIPITSSTTPTKTKITHSLYEVVLLVIAIILFYIYVLAPKSRSLNEQKNQLAQLQNQQRQWEDSLKSLQKLALDLANGKTKIVNLDEALPLSDKSIDLNLLMRSLANDSGVTVGDITISGPGDAVVSGDKELLANPYGVKRTLQRLTASVFVIGTYQQLQTFLQKLENYGRVMDVTTVDISSAKDNLLSIKLGINSYYFAQGQNNQ